MMMVMMILLMMVMLMLMVILMMVMMVDLEQLLSHQIVVFCTLRETGATTKDDLSVVLGEFDLSSDSDSFDTNR